MTGISLFGLLGGVLARYRTLIGISTIFALLESAATLLLPYWHAKLIDEGIARGDVHRIMASGLIMLGLAFVDAVSTAAGMYCSARLTAGVGRDLRATVFARVQSLSSPEMDRFGISSLVTRTVVDVRQVQLICQGLVRNVVLPCGICGGSLVLALRLDVPLSVPLLAVVPVLGIVIVPTVLRMMRLFRTVQNHLDKVHHILREQITGVRVVRAFRQDGHERRRFADANKALTDAYEMSAQLSARLFPCVTLVGNLAGIAVVWVAAYRADSGTIEVGALAAFLSYASYILIGVNTATLMVMMLPRAEVSARRIQEVLTTEPSVAPPVAPTRPVRPRGRLQFLGVEFRYPGAQEAVLRDIDLTAEPGTVTAVIGATGSGKSTLLGLIPRLFDVTAGAVRVDGVDVRRLEPVTVVGSIGYVPQKPHLFSGTVASNLRHGLPEATDDELWDALETAQARAFVESLPEGLDAPVAQGGVNLSGGQRQRLAIARALVLRPVIYLFDDCFSALDQATDVRLRAALAPVVSAATVLLVAQRISSVRDADRIVVLDEGRIAGIGTHEDLLTRNNVYQEIVHSQRDYTDGELQAGHGFTTRPVQ
ncbi:ABC transporter ATP-binding protein [Streptomyces sp. NPDC001537]